MNPASEDAGIGPRLGRPRDPLIDASVLQATLAVLDESGYGRLTLDEVARRAGTTKPAIYRRWPTRQQLVLAALGMRLGSARAPDTGCTLCDVEECLTVFVKVFRRITPEVLGPLLADCTNDPELQRAFMTTLFDPPRAAVKETLNRAYERGDLREQVDRALIVDLLGSFVYYRALFRHAPTSHKEIERAVKALMQGIASDYPRLLAHSRMVSAKGRRHQHG